MAFIGNGAQLTDLDAGDIASGTVPTARLGSGTANSSTFLRGDQTYASVAGAPNPLHGRQVFTSSGTFTVPTGVTTVLVTVIGAGGNGGNGIYDGCNWTSGGGGGSGGFVQNYVAVTSGGSASVTIGTVGGSRTSSFAGGSTITASGGSNGSNSDYSTGFVGACGSASIMGVTAYGTSISRISEGYFAQTLIPSGGVRSRLGLSWSINPFGVAGSSQNGGLANSFGYGAGGGGGADWSAGSGGNGLVIVEW
jgi:hypothetical protein